jgi:hypothetical protein
MCMEFGGLVPRFVVKKSMPERIALVSFFFLTGSIARLHRELMKSLGGSKISTMGYQTGGYTGVTTAARTSRQGRGRTKGWESRSMTRRDSYITRSSPQFVLGC